MVQCRFFKHRRGDLENVTGLYLQSGKKVSVVEGVRGRFAGVFTAGRLGGTHHPVRSLTDREALHRSTLRKIPHFSNWSDVLPTAKDMSGFSIFIVETGTSLCPLQKAWPVLPASRNMGIQSRQPATTPGVTESKTLSSSVATQPTESNSWLPMAGISMWLYLIRRVAVQLNVLTDIARLKPERIIYVSCDPSTLARDCGTLSADGYDVMSSVPVDMFPQTYHLESVTLLKRM